MSEPRVSDKRLTEINERLRDIPAPSGWMNVQLDDLRGLALDLRDARAELAAMRPVVEAAEAVRDARCTCSDDGAWGGTTECEPDCPVAQAEKALDAAVDDYRGSGK